MDIIKIILEKLTGFDYWVVLITVLIGLTGWYYLGKQKKSERKSAKRQIIFAAILVVIAGLAIVIKHFLIFQEYVFPKEKSGILVLKIKGDINSNLQLHLVSTLNEELSELGIEAHGSDRSLIEVTGLDRAHKEAQKIGKNQNAVLVIWGSMVDSYIFHPRITVVVDSPSTLIEFKHTLKFQDIKDMMLPPELLSKPICLINFLKGYNYYKEKDYSSAIIYFEESYILHDSSIVDLNSIRVYIGNCYSQLSIISDKSVNIQKAISYYNKAIYINPSYARAYNNRGVTYARNGQFDLAISDYNKAIEIEPEDDVHYYNRGLSYTGKGQYDLAISDHNKSIKLNPDNFDAYYDRGLVCYKQGLNDQAISDLSMAIEINPIDARAYNNRGVVYANMRQFDLAISDYNKAIEIDPEDDVHYYNRGLSYTGKGQYDLAISDHNKSIELNPKNSDAYYDRGLVYYKQGLNDQAISDFSMAIEINPIDTRAYNNRGVVYANMRKFDLAISNYNKAIEINPQDAVHYHNRALSYANKNLYNQAISDYNKAIEIDLSNAESYYYKAIAYDSLYMYDKALNTYREFLKYSPSKYLKAHNEQANHARARIQTLEKE